jgi:hypothetical protein
MTDFSSDKDTTMKRFFQNLFRQTNARKASFKPRLDSLEDRVCATVTVTTPNNGQTLRIVGDGGANLVRIQQADSFNQISIRTDHEDLTGGETLIVNGHLIAGHSVVFTSSQITTINIDLLGGNDTFSYKLTGTSDFTNAKTVNLTLGGGTNTANFDFFDANSTGPAHPAATLRANLNINFTGGANSDTVTARFGAIDSAQLKVTGALGAGDDFFSADLFGDLSHAKADFSVAGGLGRDQLFVTAEDDVVNLDGSGIDLHSSLLRMNLQGDGLAEFIPSRNDNDIIAMTYNGFLDNGTVVGRAGGNLGRDQVGGDFTLQAGSQGTLDVGVFGGAGNDALKLFVHHTPNPNLTVTAIINGGPGADSAQSTTGVVQVTL